MELTELKKLKRRLETLQIQIRNIGPMMRGSIVVIGTKNKQAYFSLNKNKNNIFG